MDDLKFYQDSFFIPLRYRWVISDSKITELYNIDEKNLFSSGGKEKLKSTQKVFYLFIYVASFFRVILYYIKQFFIVKNKSSIKRKCIIFEGDREYCHANFFKVVSVSNDGRSQIIQGFNINKLMSFQYVGFFDIVKQFFISIYEFSRVVRAAPPIEINSIILKTGIKNISAYTYLYCFLKKINADNPKCQYYVGSGSSLLSFALTTLKMKTIYIAHGLLNKTNLSIFPDFNKIYLYSKEEEQYFKKIKILSSIKIYNFNRVHEHNKSVVIFLTNDDSDNHKDILNIIEMFRLYDYVIYFKYHPRTNEVLIGYQHDVLNNKAKVLDNVKYRNAENVIQDIKPSFVVGLRGSTVICESLNMSVLPILFDVGQGSSEYELHKESRKQAIYPFSSRALCWPLDRNIINKILVGKLDYTLILDSLKCHNTLVQL